MTELEQDRDEESYLVRKHPNFRTPEELGKLDIHWRYSRGECQHEPTGIQIDTIPPVQTCKLCGAKYWSD